jgi:hypothetical protein
MFFACRTGSSSSCNASVLLCQRLLASISLHRLVLLLSSTSAAAVMGARQSRPRRFTPTHEEEVERNHAILAATKQSYETDALMGQVSSRFRCFRAVSMSKHGSRGPNRCFQSRISSINLLLQQLGFRAPGGLVRAHPKSSSRSSSSNMEQH